MDVVAEVNDDDLDNALELVEAALSARLVMEIPEAVGSYRFSHALVHDTLYDGLSALRRARLHHRLAEPLEARPFTDSLQLAHHYYWQAARSRPGPSVPRSRFRSGATATTRWTRPSRVVLAFPAGATIADGTGVGTIVDDDVSSGRRLTVGDVTIDEGDSGERTARVTVALSRPDAGTITVNYTTVNGSAVQPGDYSARAGTLTFNPGDTSKKVDVPVKATTPPTQPSTSSWSSPVSPAGPASPTTRGG